MSIYFTNTMWNDGITAYLWKQIIPVSKVCVLLQSWKKPGEQTFFLQKISAYGTINLTSFLDELL